MRLPLFVQVCQASWFKTSDFGKAMLTFGTWLQTTTRNLKLSASSVYPFLSARLIISCLLCLYEGTLIIQPHFGTWEVNITIIIPQLYFQMLCAKEYILLICYACYNCHGTAINIKVLAHFEVCLSYMYMQIERDTRSKMYIQN